VVARKYIKNEVEKRKLAEERRAAYAKLQEEKLAIVNKKKLKILDKIRNTAKHRFASRIQRCWRKFHKKKVAIQEAEKAKKKILADLQKMRRTPSILWVSFRIPNEQSRKPSKPLAIY